MTGLAERTSLSAPYSVEFPFERTVGPKIGTFLGGLKDARLFGVRTAAGIRCPPLEFDPMSGAETGDLVELEATGSVTTWSWVPARAGDPLPHDFAWALIAVDGTVGSFMHAVDVGGDIARMATGMRVRARWSSERVGNIRDIECFEAVP